MILFLLFQFIFSICVEFKISQIEDQILNASDPKQQMEKTLKQVDDIKKKRDAQNEYRKKHGVNLK